MNFQTIILKLQKFWADQNCINLCAELRVTVPETMKYFCTSETIALYIQKYVPVSYTHLDVYKRQTYTSGQSPYQSVHRGHLCCSVAQKHYRHTWESVPLQIVIAEVCFSLFYIRGG